MNRKIFVSFLAFVTLFALISPKYSFAEDEATRTGGLRGEIRKEIKEDIKDLKELNKKVLEKEKEAREKEREASKEAQLLKKNLGKRVFLKEVTLTAKTGDTLPSTLSVVDTQGKTYSVEVTTESQLRRKFFGKASLPEFQINNILSVAGVWGNDEKTIIKAKIVQNLSIQKRFGVFIGKVTEINGSTIVIESTARGKQTITLSTSTKLVARNEKVIGASDVLVGHIIRVKGLWDRSNNTVTEVTNVKDYSLPAREVQTTSQTSQ